MALAAVHGALRTGVASEADEPTLAAIWQGPNTRDTVDATVFEKIKYDRQSIFGHGQRRCPGMLDLSKFRAVIFDFDGVIVDSETMQARAWTRVGRELGFADCQISVERIAGRVDVELAPMLFPGHDPRRCVQRKWQIEAEMEAAGELRLVHGVDQFVHALARTHRLAICSSCHVMQLRRRLERVGLSSLFSVVVGTSAGVAHKPAPDLYLRALAQLGVGADEACAIEDSETGVAAARAAGIYVIQLVHPGQPRAALADEWFGGFE